MADAGGPVSSGDPVKQFRDNLIALLPHLRAFARGLCGRSDKADDLAQDAVMRAWAAHGSFTPGTNMKAWVFTIARNHFLNDLRKSRHELQLEEGQAEVVPDTGSAPDDALHVSDMQRALNQLPAERREALLLVGASGFSYEEAAQVCGVPIGTMKSRVARGRAQLATLLDDGIPLEGS